MKMGDFRSKVVPKPLLNEEVEREKLGPACWRGRENWNGCSHKLIDNC